MRDRRVRMAEGRKSCDGVAEHCATEGLSERIRYVMDDKDPPSEVVVIACRWRYYAARDLSAFKRLASCTNFRVIRMPCTSMVDDECVLTAFDSGAKIVVVLGGRPDDCPLIKESPEGECAIRDIIECSGFDRSRLHVDCSADDMSERFNRAVDRIVAMIEEPVGSSH